jgi:hypothetical protein
VIVPISFKCEVCGKVKGDANRWLLGVPLFGELVPFGFIDVELSAPEPVAYALGDWNEALAHRPGTHHLCGDKCALTKQAEYLRRERQ